MGSQVVGWLSRCQLPKNSSDPKARKLPHLEVARGASHAKGSRKGQYYYVTKGELKNSRKAVPEPELRKRESKAKEAPRPSKRARRVRDEDVVEAGDSGVEREVDRLMHLDGEGVVQEEEEDPLQSQFGGHLERAPLAETSTNVSRMDIGGIRIRGVVGKGRGGGGGWGRGHGKAVAS